MQQMQQWFGAAAMQGPQPQFQPPSPCGGPATCLSPASMMVGGCAQIPPPTPPPMVCPSQQMPQPPSTPVDDGTPSALARGGQTPQELLASVMPNAFCMDKAEIESQLVAAASQIEAYDD